MEKTAIQIAIEKIDEQIEIAQVCRIEAAKLKDYDSIMNRHYGMKIVLVSFKQELVNLLELEKQRIMKAFDSGHLATWNETAEQYYNETIKSK